MKFRHVIALGKNAKNNCRSKTELIIQRHVNSTKRGFTENLGGANIVFSNNFHISEIKKLFLLFFECKFHFRVTSVHEIFERLKLSLRLKENKNVDHISFLIARLAF